MFSLQHLNKLIQQLTTTSVDVVHPHQNGPSFQAECHADHVLTYLNTIVDDVAIMTSLATGFCWFTKRAILLKLIIWANSAILIVATILRLPR